MQRRNKSATPARPSSPKSLEIKSVSSNSSGVGVGMASNSITIPSGGVGGVHMNMNMNMANIPMATVVRHNCGTGPFDKMWLNMDCCGLFCASFTYFLHFFGCYAVTTIVIPPWMSYPDEDVIVSAAGQGAVAAAGAGAGVAKAAAKAAAKTAMASASASAGRHLSFWGKFHTVAFVLVAVLAVASHFKAMTTDPGAVPPDAEPIPDRSALDDKHNITEPLINISKSSSSSTSKISKRPKRICRRCNAYKPDRAHHCSICKRCIIKMDHHCPWVNNCVGIGNHKYFLLFVFYTCLSCIYAMTLVIARFVQCIGKIEHHQPCLDAPEHLLGMIGLCVESLLFGMFTCCMIVDQWDVVSTNVTHIDRLKGDTKMEDLEGSTGVSEVFGGGNDMGKKRSAGGFRPDWLSPFAKVCFPENVKDDIMGFCRPCGFSGSGGKKDKVEDDDDGGARNNGNGSNSPSSVDGRRNVGNGADIV